MKDPTAPRDPSTVDHVVIRGHRLDLDRHVDPKLFDPQYIAQLRESFRKAVPFPHFVVRDWFDPELLDLVREEFDRHDASGWRVLSNDLELTHRSLPHSRLGPASQIYFNIVNSGWFLQLLTTITGEEDLLPDPMLVGGGLHETRANGKFGIHLDFDVHAHYGLANRMVFITYLNHDWDPAWGGALELWGGEPSACMAQVQPEFGASVLMVHGPKSLHGHPEPMSAPPGRTRRSVAAYFYQNQFAVQQRTKRISSVFLAAHKSPRLRQIARRWLPPVVADAIKKIL